MGILLRMFYSFVVKKCSSVTSKVHHLDLCWQTEKHKKIIRIGIAFYFDNSCRYSKVIWQKISLYLHSIRHATSRQMEAAIWSSGKKRPLRDIRVVKRKQLLIQLNNRHPVSMAAFRCRKDRCRNRSRQELNKEFIFPHPRSRVHATRRTKRRPTNFTSRSTS